MAVIGSDCANGVCQFDWFFFVFVSFAPVSVFVHVQKPLTLAAIRCSHERDCDTVTLNIQYLMMTLNKRAPFWLDYWPSLTNAKACSTCDSVGILSDLPVLMAYKKSFHLFGIFRQSRQDNFVVVGRLDIKNWRGRRSQLKSATQFTDDSFDCCSLWFHKYVRSDRKTTENKKIRYFKRPIHI